jgi:potassium efflux system protein
MKVSLLLLHGLPLLLLLFLAQPLESWATEFSEMADDAHLLVTPQILKAKIKEVEKTTNLEEGAKKNLLKLYHKSLGNLETAESHSALADKFVQFIETAPVEIKTIREEMEKAAQLPAREEIDVPEGATLREIEQLLLKAKANFTAVEAKVATLTRQLVTQTERPLKVSQRLAEVKKFEEELLAALKVPSPADEAPQVTEARRWMQQTQIQALHSETKMLNQELVSMPVFLELANAQREEAVGHLEQARSLVQRLEAKVNQGRQAEAARTMEQAEEAMRQVAGRPPALQQAAAVNTALSDELRSSTAALERIATEKDNAGKELKRIEERLGSARQKVELAGLSQAFGLVLLELQRNLPDGRLLRKKAATNEEMIAETGLLQIQHEEERKRIADVDAYVAGLIAGSPPEEAGKIDTELRGLLSSRRELLDKIITSHQSSLGLMAELDVVYRQLLNTLTSYDTFLSERLLWMRSTPPLRLKDFYDLPREAATLFSPGPWLATVKRLAAQAGSSPVFVLGCLVTAALLWNKPRLRTRLEKLVDQAANPATYRFTLTVQAAGLTLLLALPWSLLLATLGWQTQALVEATDFSEAVARGLIKGSYYFYLLCSLRLLLLPKGLAAGFFHWPEATLRLLRREAGWLMVTFLPAVFITLVAFSAKHHAGSVVTFGRLAFIVTLGTLATSFYRILHPKTGVWRGFSGAVSHRVLARLYPVFFLLVMLLPFLFIGFILTGFVIAAGTLIGRLLDSLWLALGLIVCHQLIEQWLVQAGRRLAMQQTLKNRDAAQAEEEGRESSVPTAKEVSGLITESAVYLTVLSAESRKLIDTVVAIAGFIGLCMVWADVLPAFRIFDDFTLWHYSAVVDGQTTQVPVTVPHAGLAVLIGIITLAATRRFPALLEMVLLKHLDMTPGGRYTATTLSRYAIGGLGSVFVLGILGFSWAQIQWLVAALGVGIGFGLQEIVANFISGLIILFERPIRVGDVVTIGNTDGVVTRIRIRATTIRDFNRKELLVPNKEFISGRLLNWSLSDPVTRILLPVGVAYGSDVQKAMVLMVGAAEENPMVLGDPKPIATFDGFGDNALLLTLRCFIGSVDDRLPATSDLHQAIDQKFREAGLSIAFPQRDIHLDLSRPLDIRILREKAMEFEHSPIGPERGRELTNSTPRSGPWGRRFLR